MRITFLLLIPTLLFFSCKKGHDLPHTETITAGGKWGIRIGSSPAEVYSRLQVLGKQQNFGQVAVVTRPYYDQPQQIEQLLPFYSSVTLMNDGGAIYQVLIDFRGDHVTYISAGGGLPVDVDQWPDGAPDAATIRVNDPVGDIYGKIAAIHQMPYYSAYKLILPDKPLDKAFDPDMANYDQWAYSFTNTVSASVQGTSHVRLYFAGGKLSRIVYQYNEGVVYN